MVLYVRENLYTILMNKVPFSFYKIKVHFDTHLAKIFNHLFDKKRKILQGKIVYTSKLSSFCLVLTNVEIIIVYPIFFVFQKVS